MIAGTAYHKVTDTLILIAKADEELKAFATSIAELESAGWHFCPPVQMSGAFLCATFVKTGGQHPG